MRMRITRLFVGSLILSAGMAASAVAGTITLTNGDTSYERVYLGYDPGRENLSSVLANYVDPLTGQKSPVLALDGSPIIVGNPDLGEDPALSSQTQYQRFLTNADAQYKLTYLGLGYAGYLNVMGVYTYADGDGFGDFVYTPLVTQGVDPAGTEVLFNVPADHYFGFYLSADGGRTERNRWYSENQYNADGLATGVVTDHLLVFETNRGLLLAWEDLPLGSDGKLGDQDYEDMIGGLLTYGDSTTIPEPATMGLLGMGLGTLIATRAGRRKSEKRGN